jgi:hypothetical protein
VRLRMKVGERREVGLADLRVAPEQVGGEKRQL